ncbi:Tex family protein [Proteiniclasticum sp. QWL-01]|uniref:Tex family protein n=1 Tax=Proteiniclasticum sp. QWL-01 TaxID=3036945 RepID=UPI00220C4922|nr:Tex family protein [Proteiniclasticum sp. QWL-01]UUM13214.1 RNA-binding transcriptional accessory protein [Clostridiaceae bacterium HFYG-1003]WFF71640.1 Tex family protein [Proteiniclasticum sp. QWL-01]
MMRLEEQIAQELGIRTEQVEAVVALLDEGNTVPFIARYRKEKTGSLDDEVLRKLSERLTYLRNFNAKREDIERLITEQGNMTEDILEALRQASTVTELDDIYRPFRPKKRTRAIIAMEKGLKPLADYILAGQGEVLPAAQEYVDEEKGIKSEDEAIAYALDILAEQFSDDAENRKWIRDYAQKLAAITSTGSGENSPYEMYFDFNEPIRAIPGHRILALNRGEKEGVLKVSIELDQQIIEDHMLDHLETINSKNRTYLVRAVKDSLKRLIWPSIEREVRNQLTEKAEAGAIDVFSKNLSALLLQAPVKGKRVMGYDPGFRTGCKIAVLDENGKYLESTAVFPTVPRNDVAGTIRTLKALIRKHKVEVISLGNGTASRESEEVLAQLIAELKKDQIEVGYVVTNEAGASVYSASQLATQEYPDLDVTVRGAISIGRRLQDPLAELVKIDPKSIGVGQYQHDIDQKKLDESLTGVVEDCVNSVGVDLNTATPSLLTYVSGINKTLADNIILYRDEVSGFKSRKELSKVKRLGPKAFEQCAGFLRVPESDEILDRTGVHPESYHVARELLELLGYQKSDVRSGGLDDLKARADRYPMSKLSEETKAGIPTLQDIIKELMKPGRDPREELPQPIFKTGILELKDLEEGMILQGTVRNVSDFGAFVDIGVHQDGLVHISQLADRFVKNPMEVVKVGDIVEVRVIGVDLGRRRISLSMKGMGKTAKR